MGEHRYGITVTWTGNPGSGTSSYTAYSRDHVIAAPGKKDILASADPQYRGDAARWNPEELLVASISACHELWYLHLCATANIVVTAYDDRAEGAMEVEASGVGRFTSVTLRPHVTIMQPSDAEKARALHEQAHRMCFISNSVNFEVRCEPEITLRGGDDERAVF